MMSLDQYLKNMDNEEAKEEAIKLISEQMSCAASFAIAEVLRASTYEFAYKDVNNSTNGSDKFNDMFYDIAKKLINSVG